MYMFMLQLWLFALVTEWPLSEYQAVTAQDWEGGKATCSLTRGGVKGLEWLQSAISLPSAWHFTQNTQLLPAEATQKMEQKQRQCK